MLTLFPLIYFLGWLLVRPLLILESVHIEKNIALIGTILTFFILLLLLPSWASLRWNSKQVWVDIGLHDDIHHAEIRYLFQGIFWALLFLAPIVFFGFYISSGGISGPLAFPLLVNAIFLGFGVGFAEEIMGQMFDEANMAQDFATKILNKDFVATNNVMPEGGYQFTLPVSLTEVNKLQYDMKLIEQSPPPNSNVCSQIQNQNELKNCWFDPEIPLTAGRVVEGAGQVTSAEKLTISLKTTGIYWPHPRATGKMGPSQGGAAGNCEGGKGTPCVPDPAYEFRDVKNLDSALLEEIKLTSYVSELFQQIFLSNEAIEFMYIGTHGHGVFRTFPYGHSAGRVTKDRKSARDGITRSGYDPRHRPWYWQCEQAGKTMVTPPYVDATTDELVITVSTPIYDNNNKLLAVVGYDVSIARLAQIVLSAKVLQHGYAYLVTADQGYKYEEYGKPNIEDAGKLVVYPGLAAADIDSGNTQLIRWEFKSANDFEATAFVNGIYKRLIDPLTVPSLGTFNKSDNLWHIAYAPVKTTKYTLAFVVPDTDIRLPATQVEKLIASIVETQVGIFIAMVVVSSLIFIWMQVEVAHFVVLPVQSLTRVIDLIIRDILAHQAGLIPWIPFYKQTLVEDSVSGKVSLRDTLYSDKFSSKYPHKVADNIYLHIEYPDSIIHQIKESDLLENKKYCYSDLGYYLFKEIIKKRYKKSLNQLANELLYKKLGM